MNPAVRRERNPQNTSKGARAGALLTRGTRGNISTSSISNTRKISETKKNWIENLCQLLSKGLNPHSKGLSFSGSENDFRGSKEATKEIARAKRNARSNNCNNIKIE